MFRKNIRIISFIGYKMRTLERENDKGKSDISTVPFLPGVVGAFTFSTVECNFWQIRRRILVNEIRG